MNTHRTCSTAVKMAALIDIENLLFRSSHPLCRCEADDMVATINAHTAAISTRTAVSSAIFRRHLPSIAQLDGGLTMVGSAKDAADDALIDAGLEFLTSGVTDLMVASGDHAFVRLAPFVRLHVLAYPEHLSRELRLAATTVTHIEYVPCGHTLEASVKNEVAV